MEFVNMNDALIDTDEEDALEEADLINCLKGMTFKHFWDYKPTREILKNNLIQTYKDTAGVEIMKFYNSERHECEINQGNIFGFKDNSNGGILESLVFNHLRKEYDINFFYDNPDTARSCVSYYRDNQPKKEKKVFKPPSKVFKKFDWATKTHK